jgi:hypothetical protein
MESNRRPTVQEERLLELLVQKSSREIPKDWKNGLIVRSMDEGAMGSLYLFPQCKIAENRILGEQVSDFQFTDTDGIEVIASLNVDNDGNLFELDIWKTNFGKLIRLPDL